MSEANQPLSLAALAEMDRTAFTDALSGVFEHSPWIAERTFDARPFASVEALHAAMVAVVDGTDEACQLALVRAHPELAGKAASEGNLTCESSAEQTGAGLDACTPAELAEMRELNRRYGQRFGFPFVMAVKGATRGQILAAFRERLQHSLERELERALEEVGRIAWLRLVERVRG